MPAYAWDGSRIVFAADLNSEDRKPTVEQLDLWLPPKDHSVHLYTMDDRGAGLRQITFGSSQDVRPTFSPDGKSVAFISNRSGEWKLWTLSLQEGAEPQRVDGRYEWAMRPWFARNGKHIFFHTRIGDRNRICKIPVEGGAFFALKQDDRGSSHGSFAIPNQDVLLCHSTRGRNWSLWRFPLDGSAPERVALAGFTTVGHGTQALNGTLAFDSPQSGS